MLMELVQKLILAVLKKEKEERAKADAAKAFVMGYDPSKHEFVTCRLPEEEMQSQAFKLDMVPPVKGTHSYMKQQLLYQCIHRFMQESQWTTLRHDDEQSGCTWLELFIQFDTLGWRSENAAFTVDHAADNRAKVRKSKSRNLIWRRKSTKTDASMNTAPNLSTELANFKAIFRYIVANDLEDSQKQLFKQHTNTRQWRLRQFAIIGQQPSIRTTRICSEEERETVETAILKQRTGANAKTVYDIRELIKQQWQMGHTHKTKLKWAKLDVLSVVKWRRKITMLREELSSAATYSQVTYRSRMIQCRKRSAWRETKHLQLRTTRGYRSITCTACHHHARVGNALCTCLSVWHQCQVHRLDPAFHRSTKSVRVCVSRDSGNTVGLSSLREAPDVKEFERAWKRRKIERDGVLHQHGESVSIGMPKIQLCTNLHPNLSARFPHLVRLA